jgi:hypothetical protein
MTNQYRDKEYGHTYKTASNNPGSPSNHKTVTYGYKTAEPIKGHYNVNGDKPVPYQKVK